MKFLPQIIIIILFQLQKINSSINFAYNIYNPSTQIVSISQGLTHLTIVSTPASSPTITNIQLFNIDTNISSILYSTSTLKIYSISEKLGLNTYLNNSYLISYTTPSNSTKCSQIYLNNFTQTFGNIWNPNTLFQIYGTPQINSIYELLLNTTNRTLTLQKIYNNTKQQYDSLPIGFIYSYGLIQSNDIAYILISNSTDLTISIYTYDNFLDFMMLQTSFHAITSNQTNSLITADNDYFAICYVMKIIVYLTLNNSIHCTIVLNQSIYDLRLSNGSIYVTTANLFYQYNASLCSLLDSYYTGSPYRISLHIKLVGSANQRVFLWRNDTPSAIQMFITDDIIRTIPNTTIISNTTNTTNMTNITNNNTNINQINNSSGIPQNPIIQIELCHEQKQEVCAVYCNYKCDTCSANDPYQKCVQCDNNYVEVSPGICQLTSNTVISVSVISFANSFRFISAQSFYCIIDNIEFYQYHKTQYKGITKTIFQQVNLFQNNEWGFFPSVINDWIQKPFDTFPYIAFTNQKFASVQHTSSLIFQTMKGFYIIQIPFIFILFIFFKFLFYRLSRYQISSVLRIYSFWTQFFVILFISNPSQIAHNSILHFQLLFSINLNFKLLHIVCILSIGFMFIFIISFFFLNEYFHSNLSKYFLVNTYRIKYSIFYNFLRFSIFPYLQCAIHIYLNNNGSQQLLMLGFLPFITSIILILLESNFSFFKSKTIFMMDSVSQVSISMYNFSLWLQHYWFQHDSQIKGQIIQICLSSLSYILTYATIFSIIFPFVYTIFQLILYKNRDNFQQIVPKENSRIKQKCKSCELKKNSIIKKQKISSFISLDKLNKDLILNSNIDRNNELQQINIGEYKNQIINTHKSSKIRFKLKTKF